MIYIKWCKIPIIIFLLGAMLHSHLSYAQVVYDNNSVTVETGPLSFTVPAGTDRLLVVCVGAFSTGGSGTAAATFNGQSMGKAITSEDFFSVSHATSIIFYLALDDGAAITSNVTISGISSVGFIGANSYTGVDQTTPLGNTAQDIGDNNVNATSHTLNPTTSSGDLLVHFLTTASAVNASLGGEATAFSGFSLGSPNQIVGGYKIATATSHNLTTNFQSALGVWAHVAAEFNQVAAAPTAPEIAITDPSGDAITDGANLGAASTTNSTDFGDVCVAGTTTASFTYTITNSGDADLDFTGSPLVALTGGNSGDFSVTSQIATDPLPHGTGNTTTFTIQFDPTATGERSTTVSIANDDADENPYTFVIKGEGLNPTVTVAATTSTVTEGGSTNLVYQFSRTCTSGSLVVNFSIEGTAQDSDYAVSGATSYSSGTGTITFADGDSTVDLTVSPTDDSLIEAAETVVVKIDSPSP
ncbi:MAG: choice-of-anchor D domain-containing protein [Chitinophagales bacterium]